LLILRVDESIDNDTWKDDLSVVIDKNDVAKVFRTQENRILDNEKDFTILSSKVVDKIKKSNSIRSNHNNDNKRESEWK